MKPENISIDKGDKKMTRLDYDAAAAVQYVDTRDKEDFQKAYLPGAVNLNLANFETYGPSLLDKDQPLVLILEKEDEKLVQAYQEKSEGGELPSIKGWIPASDLPEDQLQKMESISVEDFMEKEGDYLLLDVRTSQEITRPAPEKNLQSIPLQELAERYTELDAGLPVYTLCGSGTRATAAGSFLVDKGYQPVVIQGGMGAVEEYQNNR